MSKINTNTTANKPQAKAKGKPSAKSDNNVLLKDATNEQIYAEFCRRHKEGLKNSLEEVKRMIADIRRTRAKAKDEDTRKLADQYLRRLNRDLASIKAEIANNK